MSSTSATSAHRRALLVDVVPGERVRDLALVVGFAAIIALSAQITFPLPGTPVRFTAQTFAVLLGAATLGATRAGIGASLFLIAGQVGLPWYAHPGGHTLGYIVGFVVAGLLVGYLARRGLVDRYPSAIAVMAAGNVVIYLCALPVLMAVLGIGLSTAVSVGVMPFLIGDAAKILIAAALLPSVQRWVERAAS